MFLPSASAKAPSPSLPMTLLDRLGSSHARPVSGHSGYMFGNAASWRTHSRWVKLYWGSSMVARLRALALRRAQLDRLGVRARNAAGEAGSQVKQPAAKSHAGSHKTQCSPQVLQRARCHQRTCQQSKLTLSYASNSDAAVPGRGPAGRAAAAALSLPHASKL